MGSQIEQLKNRAKEYAKAYHEKEVKRSVHKGEMEEILRQADWLMEQKFCFCDRWDMEPCSTVYEVSPFSWDACPNGDPEWIYMLNRQEYLKKNAYGILVHRTGAVCGRDEAVYSALGKAKHEGNIRLSDDKDDRHRNPVRILDTIASASSCQGAHQRRGTV